jgi:hypothetical protein
MKKNFFLAVFVVCIVSVTFTFSVKRALSENPGWYFYTVAIGDGSSIHGSLEASNRTVGGDGAAATETGYESNIAGNGGGYDATLVFASETNSGAMASSQNINKYNASGSMAGDRVTHLTATEISTSEGLKASDDGVMGYFQGGVGNKAYLYAGTHNTVTWNSPAVVGQEIDSGGYGSFVAGGQAYYYGYTGPEGEEWTQDNITDIDRDYVDFILRQYGGPNNFSIMQGTHVIENVQ